MTALSKGTGFNVLGREVENFGICLVDGFGVRL